MYRDSAIRDAKRRTLGASGEVLAPYLSKSGVGSEDRTLAMRVNWANGITDLQIIKERERNTFCQALSEIAISPVRSGSSFNLHRSQFFLRGLTRTEREGPRFDLRKFVDAKAVHSTGTYSD